MVGPRRPRTQQRIGPPPFRVRGIFASARHRPAIQRGLRCGPILPLSVWLYYAPLIMKQDLETHLGSWPFVHDCAWWPHVFTTRVTSLNNTSATGESSQSSLIWECGIRCCGVCSSLHMSELPVLLELKMTDDAWPKSIIVMSDWRSTSPEPAAVATSKRQQHLQDPGAGIGRCTCGKARPRVPPSTRFRPATAQKRCGNPASSAQSGVPENCGSPLKLEPVRGTVARPCLRNECSLYPPPDSVWHRDCAIRLQQSCTLETQNQGKIRRLAPAMVLPALLESPVAPKHLATRRDLQKCFVVVAYSN